MTEETMDVDFRFELTRDFHRELTRVDDVSRVAGGGSSGGFFLSCFGSCGACLEPEAVVACLKDVAMVGKPVQQCGGHLGVAEHPGPLAEAEIGGDDDAGALVKFAEQVEQEGAA